MNQNISGASEKRDAPVKAYKLIYANLGPDYMERADSVNRASPVHINIIVFQSFNYMVSGLAHFAEIPVVAIRG